jgi:hypothetical protein
MKASSFVVTEVPLETKAYKFSELSPGIYRVDSVHYPNMRIVVGYDIKLYVDVRINKVESVSATGWDSYKFIKTNEKIELTLKFE